MPKGRRKAVDVGGSGDAGPSAKKTKLTNQIKGNTVQIEWEADGPKWTAYNDDINADICDACNALKKDLTYKVGTATFVIKFDDGFQKNKKTGWERRIRCAIQDSRDEELYVWEWEDEHGKWHPYSITNSLEIEAAHQSKQNDVTVVACHRSYQIDLTEMEQENTVTKVCRKVRREKSDAVADVATVTTKPEPADEEEEVKPKASAKKASAATAKRASATSGKAAAKSSAGRGKSAKGKVKDEDEEEETTVKTVVIKGKAPVDPECTSKIGTAHVYCEGKDVYDAMLNQTNLQNNNNKYYVCQLLEDDNAKRYHVWFRWGRVGKVGQNNLTPCGGNLDQAKTAFCKKFKDKTKNDWSQRDVFTKVAGQYDLLKMDYNTEGADSDGSSKKKKKKDVKIPDSKLDKRLQDLITLICDVKSMEETVVEMKYDSKKAPLGKLTAAQIKAGYAALKKIDTCLTANDMETKLVQACDEFYTRIPHDFGMKRPPVIRTKVDLKAKIALLEALGDIEIAMKLLKKDLGSDENPVDAHYKSLECEMKPLAKTDPDFKMVEDYLQSTHASTHNQYKMVVEDVLVCDKKDEKDQFVDHGNKMLLWHGSRLSNWVGILKQGLRIAPPEAPVTGYMFGKGVYFADISSKSANYCFASRAKSTGLLLLCEVSLGQTNDLLSADYAADKLPKKKHSVKGLGSVAPDPKKTFVTPDGVTVPLGKPVNTNIDNPNGYTLNYNEYIVYDTKQVKMKYLVKTKFKF
ncbi:poly [ADP-ribose] polymerase 2-like [Lineus longissimus]|uniref:poly [ADP-ribose] polymerase 2-like n=1 Tax=Lineus longissimus TaxID=88925 RepID=UPI002B4F1D34